MSHKIDKSTQNRAFSSYKHKTPLLYEKIRKINKRTYS